MEIVRARSKAVHWRISSTATEAWSVYSWWQTSLGSGAVMGMDSSGQAGLVRKKQATSRLGLAIRSGLDAKAAMRLSLHRSPVTLAMTVREVRAHGGSWYIPYTPAWPTDFVQPCRAALVPAGVPQSGPGWLDLWCSGGPYTLGPHPPQDSAWAAEEHHCLAVHVKTMLGRALEPLDTS